MILSSAKLGRLKLATKPFAFGGAGEVYRAEGPDGKEYCVKLLTKPKADDFEKLGHMLARVPADLEAGWGRLCWPVDLVHKQKVAEPAGYVMPLAIADSVQLSNLTNLRWPGAERPVLANKVDRKSAEGLKNRLVIALNISAAVKFIHSLGHVFVDLKPQNILISPEGKVSVVDVDSIQLELGNKIYWGPLGSPDYMPRECYEMQYGSGPAIKQSWDGFSLAVIIYEILLGIHPYAGSLKSTAPNCPGIADLIKAGMYVHGSNRSQFQVIPPPHDGLAKLPKQLATLFSNAFESTRPEGRPSAAAWGQALYQAAKLVGADLKPEPKSRQGTTSGPAPTIPPIDVSQPSANFEDCLGPQGELCPGYRFGVPRRGAPNYLLPSGSKAYLCPTCLLVRNGDAGLENCWGVWGKACPHELSGVFKRGVPNGVARGGLSVYFCEDCIKGR
jgi:DNA-binding helix-hairpin-helix protein with protein kinase domain